MQRIQTSRPKATRKRIDPTTLSPRKRPVQARSKTMVEMIMRATARILVRDGYEALTTNQVAREAGASVGSLYQYFASKEELVAALVDQHVNDTMRQTREELPQLSLLSVEQAVRRFVELSIEAHRCDPELHRVLVEQLPRIGEFKKIEAAFEEGVLMAEAYLRAHASEITPQNHRLTAFMLVNTIESLTHMAVLARPEFLVQDEFVSEVTTLILGYLRPQPIEAQASALVAANAGDRPAYGRSNV